MADVKATISVIIPVYQTESTLAECVQSVVSQGVEGAEIILVDDGSPDGSPAICDRLASDDSRIRVVHKANGGLSDARNAGLDIARGEWITFVDSDDLMAPGTLRPLMQTLAEHPEYDILEYCVCKKHASGHGQRLQFDDRVWRNVDEYWLQGQAYSHSYMCNKVFRRTLFGNVRFPVGLVFEDMHTLPKLLRVANVVATTSHGTYIYRENRDGITATAGPDELRQLLKAHLNVIDRYWGKDGFDLYYLHVLNIQLSVCGLTGERPLLRGKRVSLRSAHGIAMKAKAALLNLLGIRLLCNIYKALPMGPRSRS